MTTQGKQDSTAIQQKIRQFEIFSENKGRIGTPFNPNEGKVNAKGMIAPPVSPRSPETKLSSQKAAPPVPPKSQKVKEAGKRIVERLQADRFAADRSKFLQSMLHETDSPRVDEAINTPERRFKYEVEMPGFIHTTARKNHVGSGLNVLHTRKKQEKTPTDMPLNTVDGMLFEGINDSTPCLTPRRNEVSSAAEGELEIIKFLKTLSTNKREALGFSSKQQDNQKVETSKKTYNPMDDDPVYKNKKLVSPDRLNVHPLLHNNANMYGNITSGTKPYSAPERCMVTHDGSKLETKMERKHEFQSDPSIKHVKVDTAVCSITKGNNKKGINRPDVPYKQEPLSEISKVNVKELANRFRGC